MDDRRRRALDQRHVRQRAARLRARRLRDGDRVASGGRCWSTARGGARSVEATAAAGRSRHPAVDADAAQGAGRAVPAVPRRRQLTSPATNQQIAAELFASQRRGRQDAPARAVQQVRAVRPSAEREARTACGERPAVRSDLASRTGGSASTRLRG